MEPILALSLFIIGAVVGFACGMGCMYAAMKVKNDPYRGRY